jgi:SET domain-containing protein
MKRFLIITLNIIIIFLLVLFFKIDEKKIEMKPSPIHGRGMFARSPIRQGEIIEVAPLIYFNREEVKPGSIIRDYDIGVNDNKNAIMLGYASIYNHSNDPNIIWIINEAQKTITMMAVKNIKINEEILVSYGENYWDTRLKKQDEEE